MSVLMRLTFGLLAGLGLWLASLGLRGQNVIRKKGNDGLRTSRALSQLTDQLLLRCSLAVTAFALTLVVTRWPVAALTAACGAWYAPTGLRQRGSHEREMAVVEGIATWTEQIRDTLAAANGLEHALSATAALAPNAIAGPVERLAARIDYERLPDALRRLADEINHPMADFVVAALVIAAEKEARDLGALLTHLSESARGEAQMRSRVWVGRARSRSAVRIIVTVVVLFILGLLTFNRAYLQPYDSASGQFVLGAVLAIFAGAFVMMQRMGAIKMPQRFIGRRQIEVAA
jgi:tight adherence protein B